MQSEDGMKDVRGTRPTVYEYNSSFIFRLSLVCLRVCRTTVCEIDICDHNILTTGPSRADYRFYFWGDIVNISTTH